VLSAGSQTLSVTFTPTDAKDYATATASVTIQVNASTPALKWAPPAAITYGTALSAAQQSATASVPGVFTYAPSPGTVLSAGSQTLSVTFTPTDTTDYATATASVTLQVNALAPALKWATPAAITYGTALSTTQLVAKASVPGVYTYTPSLGTVLSAGSQTLSVTFTPADATDYATATASVTLQVNATTTTLKWATPAAITYGTALSAAQLNATASVPGAFVYTPSLNTVLTAGSQTLSVTFTPTDATDYATATATVTLTVSQAVPALKWATPAAITNGTALSATQLNATASVPGAFVYTPSFGTVLSTGAQTLSVTFTPIDAKDYKTATASVTLTVSQAVPALSWATPAAIIYGTALSATQLNATAKLSGEFTYTPSQGTVLNAGTHTLYATFAPTDTTNYATATINVPLTVSQAVPQITWAPTGLIAVGMALGSSQLDAIARAPGGTTALAGSYVYTPYAGSTFSSSGTQTLSVTFTPSDTEDYTAAKASVPLTVTANGVAAWGDSLTSGGEGNIDTGAYPKELQQLISQPVINLGVSAQTSTQIGAREGGVQTTVTVSGGSIPATGGVQVTFATGHEAVTSWGPADGVAGTILGVHGTIKYSSGIDIFTRTEDGSSVSAPGHPQFIVDTPYADYIPIFWEGANNAWNETQVPSDIAAQVATVPSTKNYLVLSVTNDNTSDQWEGAPAYQTIININNHLANICGSHYLDIRKILVDSYDPTQATDVSDYSHDMVPTSLRSIFGHGTLVSSIGAADTSFTVKLTTGTLAKNAILTIDTGENAENVQITGVSGSTVTVTRNFGGVNAAHAAGTALTESDYVHLNAHGYQIIANSVAQYLAASQ
jgi:hypothetical protein